MMMTRKVWFTFAKKPGSKEPGIRPIKDKVHRFVTGVQPKFKQNKVWFPKPDILKVTNPGLLSLVDEMVNELSKFTLAGGVSSLSHDDAIDLLNQFSEMEIYVPSSEVDQEKTVIFEGEIYTGYWDDDGDDNYRGSTIF
jgi:hypothetical protein